MFENPREADKQEILQKCSENSRSQIVFRTDIFRKLTLGAPDILLIKGVFYLLKEKSYYGTELIMNCPHCEVDFPQESVD